MLTSAKYQAGTHDGKPTANIITSSGALRDLRSASAGRTELKSTCFPHFCFPTPLWEPMRRLFLTQKLLKRFPSCRPPPPPPPPWLWAFQIGGNAAAENTVKTATAAFLFKESDERRPSSHGKAATGLSIFMCICRRRNQEWGMMGKKRRQLRKQSRGNWLKKTTRANGRLLWKNGDLPSTPPF